MTLFGCASAAGVPGQSPPISGSSGLPPVPVVTGALAIDVVYPAEGAQIAVLDSTFIFGSVGRGDASLTINGAPVQVARNGAWLAFLPVPPDGIYAATATAGGQRVSAVRRVRVPGPPPSISGNELRILPGSVFPTGVMTRVRGETLEVGFRGTPGATARLVLPNGTVVPLVERQAVDRASGFMVDRVTAETGIAEYFGTLDISSHLASVDTTLAAPGLTVGPGYLEERQRQGRDGAVVELWRGNQVVRAPFTAGIGVLERSAPRVAVAATTRADSTVIGRRQVGADQAWDFFWPNGTRFTIDGESAGFYRVRLTPELSAWVAREDVLLLPGGTPAPHGFVGPSIQLDGRDEWTQVRFSMTERLPFRVDPGDRGLSIEFYGATGRPAYVGYGPENPFVELIDWQQPTDDLFRFNVHLSRPLWGYRYHWEGNALVLDVRKPPVMDPANPLRGLTIAIDAGHRGAVGDIGAIGPTRLTEVDATLAVTKRLAPMLRAAGAIVIEIRPDTVIVPLINRPILAERADADLFVSVHFNAFPDGVDPFANHGTTMFYYWPQSLGLARRLEREILGETTLPDRGVRYQNLGIPRTQWMPTVLTESLFLMFPQQEAALRDSAFIERLAGAHVRAMEAFVREQATPSAEEEQAAL